MPYDQTLEHESLVNTSPFFWEGEEEEGRDENLVARVRNLVACVSAACVFRIIPETHVLVFAPSTRAHRPRVQKVFDQHREVVREEKSLMKRKVGLGGLTPSLDGWATRTFSFY